MLRWRNQLGEETRRQAGAPHPRGTALHAGAGRSCKDPVKQQRMRAAVGAYFRSVAAGHTPTRWDLLCRYPDLADELEQFLARVQLRAGIRAGRSAGWVGGERTLA